MSRTVRTNAETERSGSATLAHPPSRRVDAFLAPSTPRPLGSTAADAAPDGPPRDRARAAEPLRVLLVEAYWTTARRPGQGTGLGLFISKGIVEAHGGRMWIESRVGDGTNVRFTIPIAATA